MQLLPIELVETRRKYLLFKNDCGVTDMARTGGVYEHYIFDYVREHLKVEGKTIVDVGANFGFHTLEFAELVGDTGHVISFEPQRLVYYQLCGNVLLNGFKNVHCYQYAVGDKRGKVKIENVDYTSKDTINIGNSHVNKYLDTGYDEVDMTSLDHVITSPVAVIKIDVQGFESYVLTGAVNTIKKYRPVIFIEIEAPQLEIYGFKPEQILQQLKGLGYKVEKTHPASHLVDYVATPIG